MINGFPVLGGIGDLNDFSEPLNVVVAIGDPLVKRKIIKNIKKDS